MRYFVIVDIGVCNEFFFSNTISTADNKNSEVSEVVSLKKDTQTSAPVIGIIETEDNTKNPTDDDGEVFYIFYENEDLPQVESIKFKSLLLKSILFCCRNQYLLE